MNFLHEVCSLPTAPFAEGHVVAYVERFVKARRRLRLSHDKWGNLLIELPSKSKRPRWVFAAHMDHPGLIASEMLDARTLRADFRGGVLAEYVEDERVRFFHNGEETTGTITEVITGEDRGYPSEVVVRVSAPIPPGAPGMFDQGEGRVKGGKFYARAIDDLGGVAGALAMIDELHANPPESPVAVLLTRAEEEAFIGAIGAVLTPQLLKKSDRLIAIECSAMQPYAPQGAGTIIRVGDRTSIFNSSLTYHLTQVAADLAKADKSFKYQRALMPGGTCEASVYDAYGYHAGSICVPLGNYHNMDREKQKIGPEYIDVTDWKNMVKLFVELARRGHTYEEGLKPFRRRIEKRFKELKGLL